MPTWIPVNAPDKHRWRIIAIATTVGECFALLMLGVNREYAAMWLGVATLVKEKFIYRHN